MMRAFKKVAAGLQSRLGSGLRGRGAKIHEHLVLDVRQRVLKTGFDSGVVHGSS